MTARSARRGRMDQARRLYDQRNHRQSGRWPRSVVERVTLGWKPLQNVQAYLVWEHFSERRRPHAHGQAIVQNGQSDEPSWACRMFSACLCRQSSGSGRQSRLSRSRQAISVRVVCRHRSIRRNAFEVPYGYSLPYVVAGWVSGAMNDHRSLCQHHAIDAICATSKRRSIRATSPRTIRWN